MPSLLLLSHEDNLRSYLIVALLHVDETKAQNDHYNDAKESACYQDPESPVLVNFLLLDDDLPLQVLVTLCL